MLYVLTKFPCLEQALSWCQNFIVTLKHDYINKPIYHIHVQQAYIKKKIIYNNITLNIYRKTYATHPVLSALVNKSWSGLLTTHYGLQDYIHISQNSVNCYQRYLQLPKIFSRDFKYYTTTYLKSL